MEKLIKDKLWDIVKDCEIEKSSELQYALEIIQKCRNIKAILTLLMNYLTSNIDDPRYKKTFVVPKNADLFVFLAQLYDKAFTSQIIDGYVAIMKSQGFKDIMRIGDIPEFTDLFIGESLNIKKIEPDIQTIGQKIVDLVELVLPDKPQPEKNELTEEQQENINKLLKKQLETIDKPIDDPLKKQLETIDESPNEQQQETIDESPNEQQQETIEIQKNIRPFAPENITAPEKPFY